ncbi:toxin-antitoxin system YwqK family antitoxin [Xanthomarina sp. F1114]|uniref:toxin-antitoxin system YwqK family antitoxin n=1 Tax=Xanthomarina sp. F1114 TaxID=2996019 RepID=UPI00225E0C79|nr:toxin-antitoxin system YwqK family antitoxin [Xanthomarina sp. F1114]MCX7547580.1 toxin-antitoxin system YwqK family antitoxin [Xanthomarina sp. F1114]
MKQILVILILFMPSIFLAQTINQFDENGKRHGVWKKNFENTDIVRYEGEFKHGKEIGIFKFYKNINNNAVLTASKEFNEKDNLAEVFFYASNGNTISKGQMNGKDYIGEWIYYHKDSKEIMTLEHYNNEGVLAGESLVYYKSGQIAEKRFYKKGKLDGKATWFYENGKVMKVYTYKDGLLHGEAKFYTSAGVLEIEGQYKNDRKDGVWKYYKEDGTLSEEKDYTVYSKNPYLKRD